MDIVQEVDKIGNYIIDLRRYFHKHPELSLQEVSTSKKIKEELINLNIPYVECGETGIVAEIGKSNRKVIGLRADMDALKIFELTDVEYTSQNYGVMHACGHDSHMASLLGAAKILKNNEELLNGKIKLIFQPAEENSKGAKIIIESGYIDNITEIFGLHVLGDIECGKISIEEGVRMAASQKFRIKVIGKSGHAGKPHQCVDATLVCASIVVDIQSIVSRELDPIDPAVITIGHMVSGEAHNIISGEAFIEGTVRMFSIENSKKIENAIKRIAYCTATAHGASAIIDYDVISHPAVYNDHRITKIALTGAKKIFDEDAFITVPKMMLGEDFSSYQSVIPGAFAFVGASNPQLGINYPNHNEKFDIDERATLISTKLYLAYALESLSS